MSFSRWIHKPRCLQTMNSYLMLKRNGLSSHKRTWRKLKCIFLRHRSQSENTYILSCSNLMAFRRGSKEMGHWFRGRYGNSRAARVISTVTADICMAYSGATTGMNCSAVTVIGDGEIRVISSSKRTPSSGTLVMGEECVSRGRTCEIYFPLHLAMNIQLVFKNNFL